MPVCGASNLLAIMLCTILLLSRMVIRTSLSLYFERDYTCILSLAS